jgi:hypothetical protein
VFTIFVQFLTPPKKLAAVSPFSMGSIHTKRIQIWREIKKLQGFQLTKVGVLRDSHYLFSTPYKKIE